MIQTSVVVPVGRRVAHLMEQLEALAHQETDFTYEVIVVDNSPQDRSLDVPGDLCRVVHAPERSGPGYARNVGARQCRADIILFCDADDVVSKRWVDTMSYAARSADVFGGPIDESRLDPLDDPNYLTPSLGLPRDLDLMPWCIGANIGLRAQALAILGGWNESYRASEEIDLCWRAQLAGLKLISVPDALVFYRPRASVYGAFVQGWVWGFAAPRLLREYRRHGLRSTPIGSVLGDWARLGMTVPKLTASRRLRRDWARLLGLRVGRTMGSVRWRRVLL